MPQPDCNWDRLWKLAPASASQPHLTPSCSRSSSSHGCPAHARRPPCRANTPSRRRSRRCASCSARPASTALRHGAFSCQRRCRVSPHDHCFLRACWLLTCVSCSRSFLTRAYPTMKKNNPQVPILLREAQGTLPKVFARYDLGRETSKSLDGKAVAAASRNTDTRIHADQLIKWQCRELTTGRRPVRQADRGGGDQHGQERVTIEKTARRLRAGDGRIAASGIYPEEARGEPRRQDGLRNAIPCTYYKTTTHCTNKAK